MAIELPNLDDRNFDDLIAEAKALIPKHAPDWTDHNPTDPGITLLELFAYICDMLIYRTNRISEANKQAFLQLITGDNSAAIDQAIVELGTEKRAITVDDYVHHAKSVDGVAKVYCHPQKNYLDANHKYDDTYNNSPFVSLIVIQEQAEKNVKRLNFTDLADLPSYRNRVNEDTSPLLEFHYSAHINVIVRKALSGRLLLTTQLVVAPPVYVPLQINLSLRVLEGYREDLVKVAAQEALFWYLHPLLGGNEGVGWLPGQTLYNSQLMAMLDQVEGIDYLTATDGNNIISRTDGKAVLGSTISPNIGLPLNADELPWIQLTLIEIPATSYSAAIRQFQAKAIELAFI